MEMTNETRMAFFIVVLTCTFIFSTSIANAASPVVNPTYGPVVAITIDDVGGGENYQLAVSELQSRNLGATLCTITNRIDQPDGISKTQISQLYEQGFEFTSHSYSHPIMDQLSADQLEREIVGSRNDLINAGAQVYTFSYPYGSGAYNVTVRSYVQKAGYSLAVKGTEEYWDFKNYDRYAIGRFAIFNYTTLTDFKKIMSNASGKKVAVVLLYHDFSDSNPTDYTLRLSMSNFRAQLDYLKSVGATVLTTKQIYDLVNQNNNNGYLAGNKNIGRIYFIYNNSKYYITSMTAFASYGFNTNYIKWDDPGVNYPSARFIKDYLLNGSTRLPDKPYVAGDASDGSLFYIYGGMKYPITSMTAFNKYGFNKLGAIAWGDVGLNLPLGYELDGKASLPNQQISGGYLAGNDVTKRIYYIFDGKKYYITSMTAFNKYGFKTSNIKWNDPGINYQQGQFIYDYVLDGGNPLPYKPYLVGNVDDGSIYYVYNYKKYQITSMTAFNKYGLNVNNIMWGNPFGLGYPNGVYALDGYSPPPDWFVNN